MGAVPFRCGFVALLGRVNAGKSTLVNRLVGQQVAITSPKAQTTRRRILGMHNDERAQLVFVDTPGMGSAESLLPRALHKAARTAAAEADAMALVVAVHNGRPAIHDADRQMLGTWLAGKQPKLIVLNKIDLLADKRALLPWMSVVAEAFQCEQIVPVSARKGDGIEALRDALVPLVPVGPPLYASDVHTAETERGLCAELLREQLLWQLADEVPHSAAVVLEEFVDERAAERPICRLRARIIVEREGQKAIVIGHRGSGIKELGQAARARMERLLQSQVYLELFVAVDPKWTLRPQSFADYGVGEATA